MTGITNENVTKTVENPVVAPQNTSYRVALVALLILSAAVCAAGAHGLVNKTGFIAKKLGYIGSQVATSAGGAIALISIALISTKSATKKAKADAPNDEEIPQLRFVSTDRWTYVEGDEPIAANQYHFNQEEMLLTVGYEDDQQQLETATFYVTTEPSTFGFNLNIQENGIFTNFITSKIFDKTATGAYTPTQDVDNQYYGIDEAIEGRRWFDGLANDWHWYGDADSNYLASETGLEGGPIIIPMTMSNERGPLINDQPIFENGRGAMNFSLLKSELERFWTKQEINLCADSPENAAALLHSQPNINNFHYAYIRCSLEAQYYQVVRLNDCYYIKTVEDEIETLIFLLHKIDGAFQLEADAINL
ncbi:MAG: hypothetical protein K0U13_02200 [Chlamydiae bacterium]|nr:hypothetical protein [Chlamydiales bacterium]MCH9703582.1 hypothetical protein [Chlamydiota bacterium]